MENFSLFRLKIVRITDHFYIALFTELPSFSSPLIIPITIIPFSSLPFCSLLFHSILSSPSFSLVESNQVHLFMSQELRLGCAKGAVDAFGMFFPDIGTLSRTKRTFLTPHSSFFFFVLMKSTSILFTPSTFVSLTSFSTLSLSFWLFTICFLSICSL